MTPFFDTPREQFLQTAESVLQQTFQAWEWLIVDDASTSPEALDVLSQVAQMDERVRVVRHAHNQGPGAARNSGFTAAVARFVVQLDSDNLLEPTAIEKWLWFLLSHPEFSFVKGYTVGFGAQEYVMRGGFHERDRFLTSNQVDATAMVRKDAFDAVGGYDPSIRGGMEDWDFWLRCADRGFWGSTVPEPMDWFRRRPRHSDRWPDWDEGPKQAAFIARLRERFPQLYAGAFPDPRPPPIVADAALQTIPFQNALVRGERRLLLLVPWLAWGGADAYNLTVIEQLQARGWHVTVVATLAQGHHWEHRFRQLTPDVFVLPRFARHCDHARCIAYLARSRGVAAIFVSHSESAYRLLPLIRSLAPEVPVLDYCHVEEPWDDGGYPRHSLRAQPWLDLTLVSSQHLVRWMTDRGGDAARISSCPINVNSERWCPDAEARARVRRDLNIDDEEPLILFAGRVCPQKQPRALAEVLRELASRKVRYSALIAGDGPDLPWLRGVVQRAGLSGRVTFLGAVSNQRVRDLIHAADVLFLPSSWEGIALVLYEAMACSRAVVASDVGGQAELVTPECGVLVPPTSFKADVAAYADALQRLLQDRGLAMELGRAGRARVCEHFRLVAMVDALERAVGEAAHLHQQSPRALPSPERALELVRPALALLEQRDELLDPTATGDPLWGTGLRTDWRARTYRVLHRWHEPVFHWYVGRGWTWMHPVRSALRTVLLRVVGVR